MSIRKCCPKCDSDKVARLPDNGISPHPGYECKSCGLAMRPTGSGLIYGIVLIIAVVICIVTILPWFGIPEDMDRVPIGITALSGGVCLYAIYQLIRPSPRIVEVDDYTKTEFSDV